MSLDGSMTLRPQVGRKIEVSGVPDYLMVDGRIRLGATVHIQANKIEYTDRLGGHGADDKYQFLQLIQENLPLDQ